MNWQGFKNLTHIQVGAFLALLVFATMADFGFKYSLRPHVVAALLVLLGVWLAWKERAKLFETQSARRLTIVFALLLVPVLISVPASYGVRNSLSVALVLVAYYFAGLALLRVLSGDTERAWLAKWILFVLAFWVADSIIQYIFRTDLFGIPITADMRVTGPFEETLRQPLLIAMFLPVALWILLRRGMIPALSFFAVAGFVAMLGGVRMVLVMLAIAAVGFYLKLPRWRFKIPVALLASAVVLAAVGLTPAMKERMYRFSEIRDIKFETLDRVLSDRATIWETASHMLLARPLTGVGAGAFAKAYDDHATRPNDMFRGGGVKVYHAHQVYFSMAAETGWPGLLGLIAAIVLCVKWYWTASPGRRDQAWPYSLGLVVYFFPFNTQPPLYHGNWMFLIVLLLFTLLLASLDGESPTKDKPVVQQV